MERFERTRRLIGEDALNRLSSATVMVFGVGGVGSYAVEALSRSGIGKLILFDSDVVMESNINRQVIATYDTVGMAKVDASKKRIKSINPDAKVLSNKVFVTEEVVNDLDFSGVDYIIDAIDNVTAKIDLAIKSQELGIPMIASMGTGNKLDPTAFKITDIYKTDTCPLCRVMRRELKSRGVKKLKVLYSTEIPKNDGERTPASISFVPSTAGLIIAGEVVRELMK